MTVSGRWKYMTGKWRTMAILFGMSLECCARSMRHNATCHACHGLDTLNTPSRPRHSGVASTPLVASTETRGVQDCTSGTSIDYVNSTDIQLVSEHGRRHLRSSSYRTLAVPRTRTSLGDRNLTVAGPHVWNSLPAKLTIRQITSHGQFGQNLKTHLFRA